MNGAPQGSTQRELKTILFADVAEYARLTESNEDLTHTNLCARFSLISNLIRHHHGVIHRTEGDSLLASFSAATNALQCAIDIQSSSSEHNETLPDNETFSLRIGINCGEVLIDNGEVFGNCVNIAKRFESLAKPGEIVFSETLFNHVHQKLPFIYNYHGRQYLKNIYKPIKTYSIRVRQNSSLARPNTFSKFGSELKKSFTPIFTYAISIIGAFFIAFQINTGQLKTIDLLSETDLQEIAESKEQSINTKNTYHPNIDEVSITLNNKNTYDSIPINNFLSPLQAELSIYKLAQDQLTKKYRAQTEILNTLKVQNKKLIAHQEDIQKRFLRVENELNIKNEQIKKFSDNNRTLIEANKNLLTKLDKVVSKQALNTYENLYAEYNPVRQQIIDIIESNPHESGNNENHLNCSIYSNKDVKPQSLERVAGSDREELLCSPNKNSVIPQSKLADPTLYKRELAPKEKKVVVYSYIPTLSHQTISNTRIVNKNIVNLYKNALSNSALQTYKTNFVLLSSPAKTDDFNNLDSEHCNVYNADYVASVRIKQSYSSWPLSSTLVVHNCKSEVVIKRDTRHLLSDSWNEDGGLYMTPSTLDSFNSQVYSVVDLALSKLSNSELEL